MTGKKFDDTNRGSIWKNEKKESDKHPDFTGSLNVDGKDYWVSAWKRRPDASDKAPALSFSIKPKDGAAPKHNKDEPRKSVAEDLDDSIPF